MLSIVKEFKRNGITESAYCPTDFNPHSDHPKLFWYFFLDFFKWSKLIKFFYSKARTLDLTILAGRHLLGLGRTYVGSKVNKSNLEFQIEIHGIPADYQKQSFGVSLLFFFGVHVNSYGSYRVLKLQRKFSCFFNYRKLRIKLNQLEVSSTLALLLAL